MRRSHYFLYPQRTTHPLTPFEANRRRQDRRLTMAQRQDDPAVIVATIREAEESFREFGFPEDWDRWEAARAVADAQTVEELFA